MPLNKKTETLPEEMDYFDCFTEAEGIRLIKTAIEQNLDIIGAGPVTKEQERGALHHQASLLGTGYRRRHPRRNRKEGYR